jgi:hypothetical protein
MVSGEMLRPCAAKRGKARERVVAVFIRKARAIFFFEIALAAPAQGRGHVRPLSILCPIRPLAKGKNFAGAARVRRYACTVRKSEQGGKYESGRERHQNFLP